jgi:hypothetical protein
MSSTSNAKRHKPIVYPSWLQTDINNATNPERQRHAGFAMAVWRDAMRRKDQGKSPLPRPMTERSTMSNPDAPYWQSTPEVLARRNSYLKNSKLTHWVIHHHGGFFSGLGHILSSAVHAIDKIPVLGSIEKLATGPYRLAAAIASGQRLDHAVLGQLKSQVAAVREVAPYAQMVVSLVPGVGTGIGAALGAATALASGRPITEALMSGIKGALPGGPLAGAGFDTAMNLAHGKSVLTSVLETARSQLPGPAQKAFDIGLALAHGRKLQNAVKDAVVSLAPAEVQNMVKMGTDLVHNTPGMSEAVSLLQNPKQIKGFKFASGLLSHAGLNEEHLAAVRKSLSPDALKGFDAALHLQKDKFPAIPHVVIPAIPLMPVDLPDLPAGAIPLASE